MLDEALAAARDDAWSLFPCRPLSKAPACANGFKDSTRDPDQLRAWFASGSRYNLAVDCESSGVVVLDADPPHGDESLHALEREHGGLPATRSWTTPSGGQHYAFRSPGYDVRCSAGQVGPGIDIRGAGGYALMPPSRLRNGCYTLDDERPPAPMPDWLVTLARQTGVRPGPRDWCECGLVPPGQRHNALAWFAGRLRAMGCNERTIVECGLSFLRNQCADGDPTNPIDFARAERALRNMARSWPPRVNRDEPR